jgi:hypothetical protein
MLEPPDQTPLQETRVKRLARSLVLAVSLLALTAGATFAHECYVVNRSSTGSQQAGTNSKAWLYVTLPMLAEFIADPSDPTAPPQLVGAQVDAFVAKAEALGVPSEFAVFIGGRPKTGGFTIGENSGFEKNGHGTDGSGVDHFFSAYFEQIVAAYEYALGQPA